MKRDAEVKGDLGVGRGVGPDRRDRSDCAARDATCLREDTRYASLFDRWLARRSDVGSKAAGLGVLPSCWTPDWTVLGVGETSEHEIDALVARASRFVLLRSNSLHESSRPAQGRTVVVPADRAEVLAAAESLRMSGEAPVLQVAVDPALLGVMSNERRVSPSPSIFALEAQTSLFGAVPRIRASATGANPEEGLTAPSVGRVLDRLAQVAEFGARLAPRWQLRFEWGWDGERLWILQLDLLGTQPQPEHSWLDERTQKQHGVTRISPAGRSTKTRKLRSLTSVGCPIPRSVEVAVEDIKRHKTGQRLTAAGLRPTEDAPVFVRTDVGGREVLPLLPISPLCSNLESVDRFLSATLPRVTATVSAADVRFLIAPYLPNRASGWARADPESPEVQIEALWGHADGLQTLSHDTYFVNTATERIKARVRAKTAAVRPRREGWTITSIPPPWDWRQVLSRREILAVANWASRLAAHESTPTQLLFLAQVGGIRGSRGLVTVYYEHTPPPQGTRRALSKRVGLHAIRTPTDLLEIPESVAGIVFSPDENHLRDVDFMRDVGRLAAMRHLPVVLEGSPLGHAFYVLENEGAEVVVGRTEPEEGRLSCVVEDPSSIDRVLSLPSEVLTGSIHSETGDRRHPGASGALDGRVSRRQLTLADLPRLSRRDVDDYSLQLALLEAPGQPPILAEDYVRAKRSEEHRLVAERNGI